MPAGNNIRALAFEVVLINLRIVYAYVNLFQDFSHKDVPVSY